VHHSTSRKSSTPQRALSQRCRFLRSLGMGDTGGTMHDLIDLIATTRAIRRYRPEPIPEPDLRDILWAATRAPSGSNRQGFHFVVLTEGESAAAAKALLGRTFRSLWATKRQTDGYDQKSPSQPGVPAALSPKARMAATMQGFVDTFEETPCVVLACLRRHREPTHTEGSSVYPAVQNLLLAARALGYGGVLTQWHGPVESGLKALLAIPDDVVIHAVIPMGRPVGGGHGPVRRRPMGELVSLNMWGEPPVWAVDPEGTRFTQAGPVKPEPA
jgi:nitroreductase